MVERDREVLVDGSDHSYRLSKLAKLGLAENRQRMAHMSRGSKVYRITDAGRRALSGDPA